MQPFPGPGERVQLSTGGGAQVRWGRRSAELFYVVADRRLNTVPVSIAVNLRATLGSKKPLFQMAAIGAPFGLQYTASRMVSGSS